MKTVVVKIQSIVRDSETQQREKINVEVVAEYADSMRCGVRLPPIDLFFDGAQYWISDGFHRVNAAEEMGALDILANVCEGTRRDARLKSFGVNAEHGLRRTNADKRRSALGMLIDKEWGQWTNRDIAKHCKVTPQMVDRLRNEFSGVAKKVPTVGTPQRETNNDAGVVSESPKKEAVAVDGPGDGCINPETGLHESDAEYADRKKQDLLNTIDAQHAQITALVERQAASVMDIPRSEQVDLVETIGGLRKEVKVLSASLEAVSAMRDRYMTECAQLKKQCAMLAKKLKGFEK